MKPATGEMLGGPRCYGQLGVRQFARLPPIKLRNALWSHAPSLQMRANTKGGHEWHVELRQFADGREIEMVVVVMRHDHDVYRRQRADSDWNRLEPLGPEQTRR